MRFNHKTVTFGFLILVIMILGGLLIGLADQAQAQSPGQEGIGVQAATGTAFTYQGRLIYNNTPITGTCSLSFKLYNANTNGSQIGSTVTDANVSVKNGYFSQSLDFGTSAFTGEARWLEIIINSCPGGASAATLSPRVLLTAAPYALSLRPGATISSTGTALNLKSSESNVLNITALDDRTDESDAGVNVISYAPSGAAVAGYNYNGGYGVYASSDSFMGIYGQATDTSGTTYGVYGKSSSPDGFGVYGSNEATTGKAYGVIGSTDSEAGAGVYGEAIDTGSNISYGVYGLSLSSQGRGVYGKATNTTTNSWGRGVYGESASDRGTGVYGEATATSGQNYGVRGETNSSEGYAMYAQANAVSGENYGVYASTNSISGTAVYGYATGNGDGVNYAIYGDSRSSNGYAGYFYGNVQVTGNLSKGGGSFKIDHPLDPANQYLYHSFVESPDMKNIYDGVVTLEADGTAWVELADWFEALNQDFRYQLTPIGGPAPNLYIAEEIQDNRFKIAGGEPGLKVSWQVTGIRHDAYAEAHRIPVEVEKPPAEQGTFLYPAEHGQPENMGLHYESSAP